MNRDEVLKIAEAMKEYGGSFARSIAEALLHADPENMARLIQAFPELVEQYKSMAEVKHG